MANYGMLRPPQRRQMFGQSGARAPQQMQNQGMSYGAGLPYYELPDGDLSNLGSLSSPRALSGIAMGYGPLYGAAHQYAMNALQFAQQNQGRQQRYIDQAVQANDPRNDAANFAYTAQQMQGQAADAGRYAAGQMRALGMGKAAQAGAMLDAQNQAREQQATMWAALRNPAALAQRYGTNADALSFAALAGPSLQGATGAYQALMNALMGPESLNTGQESLKAQLAAQKGGGLFGDLLGIAGSLGSFGGFGNVFGGLFGGGTSGGSIGQTPTLPRPSDAARG